jgi:hypothetical protein
MQITSSRIQKPAAPSKAAPQAQAQAEAAPQDQVTFGSSNNNVGGALLCGALGAVPLVGFASNFGIGIQASVNDNNTASGAAGYGALANLAGTATTVLGLTFGSDVATKVGLSMLGASGLAGAYAGFVAA